MQCYNCGENGHKAMDCSHPKKERTGEKTCYNCHKPGHVSRDCPEEKKPRQYDNDGDSRPYRNKDYEYKGSYQKKSYGTDDKKCFNCGKPGHFSSSCPEERKPREKKEYNNDRPPRKYNNDSYGSKGQSCFKCGQPGHISKDCDQEVQCFKCKKFGHKSFDCKE